MGDYKKICFVIMGFGKKTDFATGRTLDMDKSYKNIIRPAVIAANYECVRADEIQESGIIDKSMYALLMQAELVIADISTYNPNAIYELGIRHAVRPFSTIILKESEGAIPFDLDHTRIFEYAHQGEDIGTDESARCQVELLRLINAVSQDRKVDSPLYEYFNATAPPVLPESEYRAIIKDLAEKEKHIFAIVESAHISMAQKNFIEASEHWAKASKLMASEPYFIQQHALCRYKSKSPSENTALIDALNIIQKLEPDGNTTDPETLGITGAIYKNLWAIESDIEYLRRAIKYYGKGYKVRNDYYTGENYALCLNILSKNVAENDEIIYFKVEARKARENIVETLTNSIGEEDFLARVDKHWIYASLSQCYYALGDMEKAAEFEQAFIQAVELDWQRDTFYDTRNILKTALQE